MTTLTPARLSTLHTRATAARDRMDLAVNGLLRAGRAIPPEATQTLAELRDVVDMLERLSPSPEPSTRTGPAVLAVTILPNDKQNPPGKLADAEIHFCTGPLTGCKLIGFTLWERRTGRGRNVTFPARQYRVNGERRSFALLRPSRDLDDTTRVRDLILDAYQHHMDADPNGLSRWAYDEMGQCLDGRLDVSSTTPPAAQVSTTTEDAPLPDAPPLSRQHLAWDALCSITGTSFLAYLSVPWSFEATIARLITASGQDPTAKTDAYKVSVEFTGTYGGDVFTLYDYKGDDRLHIGGPARLDVAGLTVALIAILSAVEPTPYRAERHYDEHEGSWHAWPPATTEPAIAIPTQEAPTTPPTAPTFDF